MNEPHSNSAVHSRPAELDLLLACARWPQAPADQQLLRTLAAASTLDWPLFLRLAEHHRLIPLAWHNLTAALENSAPAGSPQQAVFAELRQAAAANTWRALRSLAELRRVVHELEHAGIPVRVLKGIPLAQSVFGELSLRTAGDLDLLIDQDYILPADRILRDFGYQGLFQPDRFTPRRLAFYRAHWKDIAYENPATGFEVDLHWRCFRNSRMPGAQLCAAAAHESVSFGSFEVRTLPRPQTLLYLCVHGTLDGWLYLKSLADIAALVRPMSSEELDEVAALATRNGVLPELSAALILTRRYFAVETSSPQLLAEAHPTVAHILRFTHRSLEQSSFLAGRDGIPAARMMRFEIGLRGNLRYRLELLLRVLFRARMWETIPLPDFLFALYPLLSPFEWIVFRLRQWLSKPSSSSVTLSI